MNKTLLEYTLRVRVPILIFVALTSVAVTYFVTRPEREGIGYEPEQPIKFSHKLHAGLMKIDCAYCHIGVYRSRYAVIPATSTCMNCHTIARKTRPEIIRLTKYYDEGKPIPWKKVDRLPDFVYFSHSFHVNKGIRCQDCHGRVQDMDVIKQVNSFTMSACLDCHRNAQQRLSYIADIKPGPTYCYACHR
ncbi:MAG: cytochrome c3 family protein [Candidatus Kryptoniota bacterium]